MALRAVQVGPGWAAWVLAQAENLILYRRLPFAILIL